MVLAILVLPKIKKLTVSLYKIERALVNNVNFTAFMCLLKEGLVATNSMETLTSTKLDPKNNN